MALKLSPVGWCIYVAMALWLAALAAAMSSRRRPSAALFGLGGLCLAGGFAAQWVHAGHVPLQSLFEVFLALGLLMVPLWWFAERFLDARGLATCLALGLLILVPAGFVFDAEPQKLPPALQSWLFAPHVAAYMLAYVLLILAAAQSAAQLFGLPGEGARREVATFRLVRFGFPLLTLGLALGALWGKLAWGDYWNWDPKELWALATLLDYVVYLHARRLFGARRPRLNASLALAGGVLVVLTLLWVNLAAKLFPGMHVYAS